MRLIVHFYSELTSNQHRVFVITSFCDHMCIHQGRPWYIIKVAQKLCNPRLCIFSRDCIFKNSPIVRDTRDPGNTGSLCPNHISIAHCRSLSLSLSLVHSLALSAFASLLFSLAPHITQFLHPNVHTTIHPIWPK